MEDDDPATGAAGTFTPEQLDRTVLALPLIRQLEEERERLESGAQTQPRAHPIVIEINLDHREPRPETRA